MLSKLRRSSRPRNARCGNGELHFMYDPDLDEVPELPGGSTVTLVE